MSSIEILKTTISRKGGLAKGNRFNVMFTPPMQTLLNFDGDRVITNLITGNFNARSLINDPREISILCDSVSIPGKQISTLDYQSVKYSVKIPYGTLHDDINLTFLLTNDYYMKTVFDAWINSIVDSKTNQVAYKNDITCDVTIQQLDEKDIPIYGVTLENAFPTTMNEISLSNENTDAIQKLSVSFSYDRYEPQGPLSSTASAIRNALSIFG